MPAPLPQFSVNWISLSALGGGEGQGEVGDSRALAQTQLTLPTASRRVPSLSALGAERAKTTATTSHFLLDDLQYPSEIIDYIAVPEADYAVAATSKFVGTRRVCLLL